MNKAHRGKIAQMGKDLDSEVQTATVPFFVHAEEMGEIVDGALFGVLIEDL